MRAVWVVLVAGFRRQWRSWLLLSLLIAVASGFVLASTAAGRRTDSAFPRYVASHGYDAIVYTVQPLPKLGQDVVAQMVPVQMPFYGQPACSCHRTINNGAFSVREVPPASLGRLDRDLFLTAVLRHAPTRRQAEGIATTRLAAETGG